MFLRTLKYFFQQKWEEAIPVLIIIGFAIFGGAIIFAVLAAIGAGVDAIFYTGWIPNLPKKETDPIMRAFILGMFPIWTLAVVFFVFMVAYQFFSFLQENWTRAAERARKEGSI